MMLKRNAWGAVTSLLIHIAMAGAVRAGQPTAAPVLFEAWEALAAEVQAKWTAAVQSGNAALIDETRTQEGNRVLGLLPDGAEIDDWIGVAASSVAVASQPYEATAYGFWVAFESGQEGATIVCLAKNWDSATGSQSLAPKALSTLQRGDVVRVRGRMRWVNTQTLLQNNDWVKWRVQMNMTTAMLGRSPDAMPDPELLQLNGIIGGDCVHLVLTSVEVVPVPEAVRSVQAQWEECRATAAGLQQTYARFEEIYDAVVDSGTECLTWNERARHDPRLLEALRRWSPRCLDGRFAPPEQGSANPYDMYGRDESKAEYAQYESLAPGLQELLTEEAEITRLLSRWWDTQNFTRSTAAIYRMRDYLAAEQPRLEAALADFEAMGAYLNN